MDRLTNEPHSYTEKTIHLTRLVRLLVNTDWFDYIGETVRSIFDIMEFTVNENVPGMLIFIDFQKAFDSLEWDFIFGCLESFNFGPDFCQWVKTFYKNTQSCVINNGNVSDYFFLGRGVRQGDPLSPYLFGLAAEALAIAVRQNVDIKGIFVDGQETKLVVGKCRFWDIDLGKFPKLGQFFFDPDFSRKIKNKK